MTAKTVSLALQGGGSLGAYTWGVLDALLEDGRLAFEGVTGASAGAINAVVLADGLTSGGNEGARRSLRRFWEGFAQAAMARRERPLRRAWSVLRGLATGGGIDLQEIASRTIFDFRLDPIDMQPIRSVLEASVDFQRLRRACAIQLFVNATNVRSQEIRVFAAPEITVDAVCASTCHPMVFRAVEIDGEFFWDGAFLGNPAIFPVLYHCGTSEVLLVETRPVEIEAAPSTAGDLLARMLDLSGRAALVRELRMIDFVSDLVRRAPAALPAGVREIHVLRIPPHPALASLGGQAGFRVEFAFYRQLFELGREAGRGWLASGEAGAACRAVV